MTRKGRFYIKKQQIHCQGERGARPRAHSTPAGRGVRAGPSLTERPRPSPLPLPAALSHAGSAHVSVTPTPSFTWLLLTWLLLDVTPSAWSLHEAYAPPAASLPSQSAAKGGSPLPACGGAQVATNGPGPAGPAREAACHPLVSRVTWDRSAPASLRRSMAKPLSAEGLQLDPTLETKVPIRMEHGHSEITNTATAQGSSEVALRRGPKRWSVHY